jgi:hypothetical protein
LIKRIKHIVFILLILSVLSCKKDSFIIPKNSNLKDKLARVYIFYQDDYIGYHNYVYNDDKKRIQINTYNSSEQLKKRVSYTYNTKGLIETRILENYTENSIAEYTYSYTFFDSIQDYTVNSTDGTIEKYIFSYNTIRLPERQNYYQNNQLYNYTRFYYNSSDKIWLVRNFSKIDSLLFYDEYKYYVDNSYQLFHYNDTSYLGYELFQYNANNKLYIHSLYNSNNYISKKTQYDYYENGKLKTKEEFTPGGSSIYKFEYIYFQ